MDKDKVKAGRVLLKEYYEQAEILRSSYNESLPDPTMPVWAKCVEDIKALGFASIEEFHADSRTMFTISVREYTKPSASPITLIWNGDSSYPHHQAITEWLTKKRADDKCADTIYVYHPQWATPICSCPGINYDKYSTRIKEMGIPIYRTKTTSGGPSLWNKNRLTVIFFTKGRFQDLEEAYLGLCSVKLKSFTHLGIPDNDAGMIEGSNNTKIRGRSCGGASRLPPFGGVFITRFSYFLDCDYEELRVIFDNDIDKRVTSLREELQRIVPVDEIKETLLISLTETFSSPITEEPLNVSDPEILDLLRLYDEIK